MQDTTKALFQLKLGNGIAIEGIQIKFKIFLCLETNYKRKSLKIYLTHSNNDIQRNKIRKRFKKVKHILQKFILQPKKVFVKKN